MITHPHVQIAGFRPHPKNTLVGFVTLELPAVGLRLKDVCLHRKNGSRWLSLPAKPYTNSDGGQKWAPLAEFTSPEGRRAFQEAALAAFDAFQATGGAR